MTTSADQNTATSSPKPPPPVWLGPLMVFFGAAFVGLAPIGLRLSDMEPQATAFWRFLLAIPLLAFASSVSPLKIKSPTLPIVLAGVFFALDIAFWHAALTMTSVANATFIVNLGSVSVGVLAWIFLRQAPKRIWFFAAPLAVLGAAGMSFGGGMGGSGDISGDMLAVIAALLVANYLLFASIARAKSDAMSVIFWATVVEAGVALVITLFMGEQVLPSNLKAMAAPLFLALFAQVLGQGLIVFGAGMSPPAVSGVMLMTQPVVAGLIAWPLFQEHLSPLQIGGAAFILLGVWLVSRQN